MNVYPNLQYNSEDGNEDVPTNCPILQKKLCTKGKHYLILDEEIAWGFDVDRGDIAKCQGPSLQLQPWQ